MGFYEQLSEHYDELFKPDQGELDYIAAWLGRPEKLLDIGCGTGNKTELLKDAAGSITAFDSDPAMIALAQRKHAAPNISYLVLDMLEIGSSFGPESFDAALCLGNTLVHLTGPEAISSMLGEIYRTLRVNGRFAVQILNYARILDQDVTELPLLRAGGVSFTRSYSRNGGLLNFDTELHVPAEAEPLRNSVPLYPLRPEELEIPLRGCGFKKIELYGGFNGESLLGDSFIVVALCVK